jgi:hypothetical protein
MALVDPFGHPLRSPRDDVVDPDLPLLDAMTAEIRALEAEGPAILAIPPLAALQLAGVVQLAMRHPEFSESGSLDVARAFIEQLREYFEDAPAVLEVLRRGDDPREDA